MTLGQILHSKRLELGKSIEQISTATRIHVKVLKALEEDRYGELPARAFTRGFIISYVKALQLNPEEILRDYHDFLESKFDERPEKDHGHQGYAFEGKEMEQNKRWMIIIASSAAFFAILTLLFFKPQNHKHREKHKELIAEEAEMAAAVATPTLSPVLVPMRIPHALPSPVSTVSPSPTTKISPTPSTTPTSTATPSATPTPTATPSPSASPQASPAEDPLSKGDDLKPQDVVVKVVFQALEDVLVTYHSDQRKPFSINLRKDKQLVIKATERIKVQTNSPNHLKYKLNFKNKGAKPYTEMKNERIEFKADGTESFFDPGAI